MTRKILHLIFIILFIGCTNPNEKYFLDILEKTDKVYLYKRIDENFCPIKSFNYTETQEIINHIKTDFKIEMQRKFIGDLRLELYQGDSLIGYLKIDNGEIPFVNFSNSEKGFGFRLNYSLGRFLEEITANEYADCAQNVDITNKRFYNDNNWLRFDSISVLEFVELLPVKNVAPNYFYIITTIGQADSNWISKDDIENLIKMIDSEQPAYCIMRVISSHLPVGEESTLGGQVMNLIDSYRFKRPYPYFLTDCSKTDNDRQKEIKDWWTEINK